jgi:hypothetical protein
VNILYDFCWSVRKLFNEFPLFGGGRPEPVGSIVDGNSRDLLSWRGCGFLCVVLTPFLMLLSSNTVRAQGDLTNGWTHGGNISPAGDSDSWTFTAAAGDRIVVRVGEIFNNAFSPKIQLLNPSSMVQASSFSSLATEIAVTATNTGTFTVVVTDNAGTQTNAYRLTLAKVPGAVVTASGDEGGPMTNGVMHTGTIDSGDLDVWTFSANTGDALTVRMGETINGSSLTPGLRLYGPTGVLLDSFAAGGVAAEVSVRATNSGTFTVVVGDNSSFLTGSGAYRLTLGKTGDLIVILPGDEGGPMTNGVMHTGMLEVGDLDVWSFAAAAGDNLTVRMGELVDGSSLTPAIWLYGPNGALLDSYGAGGVAAEVSIRATNSGTFTVVVGDFSSFYAGSGTYRLTLAKTGDPIVVSSGDEGGLMTNGVMHTGNLDVGELDVWSFTATTGDNLTVRMGELVNGSSLTPAVWLYGPNGALLDSYGAGGVAAEVSARATNTGTFTVVVGDFSGFYAGSGAYRLTLAKSGDAIVVSAGDEGGPMTNNVMHTGNLQVGDLDVWNFTANSGDSIVLRMGELVNGSSLAPAVWLYGPNGALLDSNGAGGVAAEVSVRATNSGTFTVVAGDFSSFYTGSGIYRLTLAKTGDPIVVSAGDEGGALTNGFTHTGTIDVGDVDVWNFTASADDSIVLRMGESSSTSLTPYLRLYGPNGALLNAYGAGGVASEVSAVATNSGTFTVIATDLSSFYTGSGPYRLTLAKSPGDFVISPGDEGGPMMGAGTYDGTIDPGDMDVYVFAACANESLSLHVDELVTNSSLTPWIRLYDRSGVLLNSISGAATAKIDRTAPSTGTYTLLVGDLSSFYTGSGTYRLTVNGLADQMKLCIPVISGTNAGLFGVGGISNAPGVLFTTTNITTPVSLWIPIRTNQFDSFGVFAHTNEFNPAEPQRYYRLLEKQ